MTLRTLDDLDLAGHVVLVRVDINVPMEGGRVSDDTRIRRSAPTVREILERGGKPVLLAHLGRPKGAPDPAFSLRPLLPALEAALGARVRFAEDCIGGPAKRAVSEQAAGEVVLLENTRFHAGEEANDPKFVASLAALGELYVNDAFSAAHRAHASTEGLAHLLPAAAGRLMEEELTALDRVLGNPERPVMAIVGGAKVSTKLALLGNLVRRVETLAIGGGMANTFLAAQGHAVGRSLCEHEMTDTAAEIMATAAAAGCTIVLPVDIVVAEALAPGAPSTVLGADACPEDAMILDAGPATVARLETALAASRTLVWNGPLGAFETPPFDAATLALARRAAALTAEGNLVSIAGGGDTVAALNAAGVADAFTYVSTAGGAFLEWLEGKTLPGVAALID